MKALKILFCDDNYLALAHDPWFKAGGATQQVVAWVRGLKALGVRVRVLGCHSRPEFFAEREDEVVSFNPDRGIPKLRYLYVRIPALVRALVREKPTHLYCGVPSPYAGLLAMLAVILRQKVILRISNDCFVDGRSRERFDPFRHLIFTCGFQLADSILCQNDYQFSQLRRRYPGKVFKIGNPYLGEIVEKPAPFEGRGYVAWVGIFKDQKNLPRLWKIARALPEVQFRVAGGSDKRLSPADQEALDGLRSLQNVQLTGFLSKPEVLKLLEGAFCLLNTSHYEGFSNTFLEAFSRGTPVFTFSHNDPDGIIMKHRLGVVFAPESDVEELLRRFLADRRQFETCSSNALRYLRENHDAVRLSQNLLEIVMRTQHLNQTDNPPAMNMSETPRMNASALDDAALDEIARKVKERCNGMLSPDVYRAIIEAGRSARPGNFIEIGTAHGAATVALALGLQARNGGSGSVKIHTVEKIVGGSRVAYGGVDENIAIIRGNFHHFGVSGLIDLHVGTSEAAAGEIPRDEPVSLLMLDADGRIDRDFALYYNRTLPGAIIIIDDCKDMPRVKRMPGGRMRIDLKHKLTFHLVQYFCRKGLIEDLEIINGTAFARKPVSVVEEVTFDFAEIVKVYQELVFSDALFPGIFREVIGRGLKAVHGQVKRRPALYKAWKKGQARVRTWRGGTAEAGVRA